MANNTIRSQSPYFDDFDPTKDYVQVLFRPGYPVQARELTTLQSFVQEQVTRFGENFFHEGEIVKGADVTLNKSAYLINVLGSGSTTYPTSGARSGAVLSTIQAFEGLIVTDSTGTVKARVLPSPLSVTSATQVGEMYVQYISEKQFTGGYIYATVADNPGLASEIYNTFESTSPTSLASVSGGIYFVAGRFVKVAEQTIVVSRTTQLPSSDIGFSVIETLITQNEDVTLFDNARGSTNEGAPGAHRLTYTLTLTAKAIGSAPDSTFYRIATYIDGVKQDVELINKQYEQLVETLARRTYDESGHYALRPFNPTIEAIDSDELFMVSVSPSKAYVKGYEVEKSSATKIFFDKESGTKTTRNFKIPVVGTTKVDITGITGTVPGSTSGAPFIPGSHIQLKAGAKTVGVARVWVVNDEFKRGVAKTELYIYDVRMFTTIQTTGTLDTTVVQGNDVVSGKTRGYVYTDEGQPDAGRMVVISSTGKFKANQTIECKTLGLTDTISAVTAYDISQVTGVAASNGFSATVTAGSYGNENASLFLETEAHIKTLKDASTSIMDNDFTVIQNTGGATVGLNAANGFYDKVVLNDGVEITKTLRYAYLTISHGTGGNYGWNAEDREVSLYYPDVHRVYAVNTGGAFQRLEVTTAGVIPQGAVVRGETSGSVATVALSNTLNINSTVLVAGFHTKVQGTGSSSQVEVVFNRGTSFTAGENIIVEVPSYETAYTYTVTYNSVVAEVGSDSTNMFLVDDGQRREYYDVARLVRKENASAPTAALTVFFAYFDADPTTNHYYSADSYAAERFYDVNPRWTDQTREINSLKGYEGTSLRNGIDFRLRVKPVTSSTVSPFNFGSRDFYEQDRVMPDSTFTTDITEFLGRIDLVALQKDGNFVIIPGTASTDPKKPEPNPEIMGLFYLHVDPVVYWPEVHVQIEKIDNRRYTMRDIGEIDKRIDRIEEALSLTMLELQALNDDVDLRTKSGFVVDSFAKQIDETSSGDTYHPEYRASIDVLNKQLITAQTSGVPIEMNVSAQVNTSTFFPGFVMKKFTEEAFSTQMRATSSHRINPFATWIYQGDVTLLPSEDNWHTRVDDYFTSLYGELRPFSGNQAQWQEFNKITTASPGGESVISKEWVGLPKTSSTISGNRQTTTTTRAQRTTTISKFETARSTGEITSTLTDSTVIQNPQAYWMRPLTVSYSVENLRPNTTHNLLFGGNRVGVVTTDSSGKASGTFDIEGQKYRAGVETFELKDAETGVMSIGLSSFASIGHLDTYKTVAKTETEIVRSSVVDNVVTNTTTRRINTGDPIAQMFTLPMETSIDRQTSVVTSLDLWFSFVDQRPNMNKVKVEIRESANGYPAGESNIIGETDYVYITKTNETTVISDSAAVNFKFREPVVLKGNTEYAIVIKSPSDTTSLYVAEIGQTLIDGSGIHDSQPNVGGYYGSFFTSQNSTTWNADQNKDLTYRLKRAKFESTSATVTLTNTISDSGYYKGDIGAYSRGLAVETFANSNYVKVYHPNHGFHYSGAEVTISGVANACNGIPASELNTTHLVWYATLDSYFVKTTTKATSTGKVNTGIWTTFATQDIVYDSIIANLMPYKTDADSVSVQVKTTTTSSANLDVGANNKIQNLSIAAPYADSAYTYIEGGRAFEFDDPKIVRSATNTNGVDLTMVVTLDSSNFYSSPIIKTGSNLNPIVFRNLTGYMLTDSDIEGLTTRTLVGGETDNTIQEFTSYIAGLQSELEHSAYVTKQVDLDIPADGFTIKFSADMAPESAIEFAYKARQIGDNTPFEELEWLDAPIAQQITEDNYGAFKSDVDPVDYTVRIVAPYEFSAFKVRARLRTRNEAQIPKLSDLRIIADI